MRKTLWACVAASALSLAFTATSFAAVNYGENNNNLFTYDETNNTITITGDLSACGEDATVLVLKPLTTDAITDDDILYITQEKAADKETALAGLGLKGESLAKDTVYTVKVGGTNITSADAILAGTFTIADASTGEKITFVFGDVTGDGQAEAADAIAILNRQIGGPADMGGLYAIGTTLNLADGTTYVFGDVTGDGDAEAADAIAILNKQIGGPADMGGKFAIGANAEFTLAK